jgi:hypothetical protein
LFFFSPNKSTILKIFPFSQFGFYLKSANHGTYIFAIDRLLPCRSSQKMSFGIFENEFRIFRPESTERLRSPTSPDLEYRLLIGPSNRAERVARQSETPTKSRVKSLMDDQYDDRHAVPSMLKHVCTQKVNSLQTVPRVVRAAAFSDETLLHAPHLLLPFDQLASLISRAKTGECVFST